MTFVIDSDVLIRAKREYYAFDIFPTFWNYLLTENANGVVGSVDAVKKELSKWHDKSDPLLIWAKNAPGSFFASTQTSSILISFKKYQSWIQANPQYSAIALADYGSGADGWLVAYAEFHGATVVTWEKSSKEQNKVKIPDLATAHGVSTIGLFDMLRKMNFKY